MEARVVTTDSCSQVADAYHNVRNQGLIRALSPSPPWAPKVALPYKRLAILAVPRPRLWQLRQTYAVQVKLWRANVVSMTRDCITRGVLPIRACIEGSRKLPSEGSEARLRPHIEHMKIIGLTLPNDTRLQ